MLRPPQTLLAVLAATVIAVTAVLGWFGWRLLGQQRIIDERQRTQQLEAGADALAAGLRGRLAEAGERLSVWLSAPDQPLPETKDAVTVASVPEPHIAPAHALPYFPTAFEPASRSAVFDGIEADEFAGRDAVGVVARYRALAGHGDPRIRAGAWLRLGRVLRKSHDFSGAADAYRQLARLGDVRTDGLPAELAGLDGARLTFRAAGDRDNEQRAAAQIVSGIDAGHWLLSRGIAEFYRDETSTASRPQAWLLADALSDALGAETDGQVRSPRGQHAFNHDGHGLLVIWRSDDRRTIALAAFMERFVDWPSSRALAWRLADADGQLLAGMSGAPASSVVRVVGNSSEYPWTLNVWDTRGPAEGQTGNALLVGMLCAVLLFLWAAAYFMARAIRREAEVSRLQSDFVAAVSHEFRSPLTTIRQMAEMLDMKRVPTEERRHAYYQVLAAEAARLQRLVETLLNFGRMEAGVEQYRFADVDVAPIVDEVVRDLESQARASGTHIDVERTDGAIRVMADGHALSIAVRNLLDNAIKYSPESSTISVRFGQHDGRTAIAVADQGPGIPTAEQQTIFTKFVRGRSALQSSVKGTGVGLSMVQHIVSAHGGEVTLDSEPGRGSTFTILLPAL